ncbi:hypothetical protein J2Z48_001763 [Croceifilum oryzae]|uniref:Uncharacterized protein n=1 Tax=Croceifilum oryzae TaxID=1553429 RepID=A0AAJ1TES3_9BACL|nr:hypothetical protein [Croceifilum oryzae]
MDNTVNTVNEETFVFDEQKELDINMHPSD